MASQDIVIGTKVDLNGLKKGEQQVKSSVDKMSDKFSGQGSNAVTSFGNALTSTTAIIAGSAVAVLAVAKAVYELADATAEMADETGKASQRMGVSLEFYQKMASAAGHAGTTISTMQTGMRSMLLQMKAVEEGSVNSTRAFEDLGVEVFNASGEMRDQEQVFTDVLMSLSRMENETERNTLGLKLLGRSASQLAPLINEGSEAIERYVIANESAVTVSEELASSSQRYNDNMLTIEETLTRAKNTALEPFIEGMANLSGEFREFLQLQSGELSLSDFMDDKTTSYDAANRSLETLTTNLAEFKAELLVASEGSFSIEEGVDTVAMQKRADILRENINLIERELPFAEARANALSAETEVTNNSTEAVIKNNEARQKLSKELPIVIDLTNQRIEQEAILAKQMEEKIFLQSQKAENDMSDTKPDFDQMKMDFAQQSFQFTEDLADIAMNNSINREQRKIDALKKAQSEELSGFIGSNRRRQQIEAKNAKEIEERERELAKKRGKMQIAQSWADAGRGIVGTWSQALSSTAPPFAIPMAIASSAMMTGIATAQTASIASAMQGFATGGIVGGGGVAPSQGADNTVATLRDTEMVLNAEQQTQLFEMANGAGGGGINIVINGNVTQDHLSELEDNIRALQNNGRTNFEVVS